MKFKGVMGGGGSRRGWRSGSKLISSQNVRVNSIFQTCTRPSRLDPEVDANYDVYDGSHSCDDDLLDYKLIAAMTSAVLV